MAALTANVAGTDKTGALWDSAESSEVLQFLRRNAGKPTLQGTTASTALREN